MNREEARRRAKALVAEMTLEEKASQIRFDSPAIERLNIPEYNWWGEGLHGVARAGSATMFPQAIALAATFDPQMLTQIGDVVSTEARAKYNSYVAEGDRDIYKNLTLWSPNVNIFRDPRWGRGHETYGEDPYLTGEMGKAYIKGLQGEKEYLKIAACAKHFAVHSGPEEKRHEFNAVVSEKDLYETYLPAFEKCVKEADVEAVMGAYNRTDGEPCCASSKLQNILRGDWGFEGHFVSDCWAIRDFHERHKVTKTPTESVALALSKGCDVNCGDTYRNTMAAYDEGLITEEMIDTAVIRLFTTRFMLGMFDKTEFDDIPYDVIECKEHRELAIEAARKSLVLLKNEGLLPIDKTKIKSVGVIGPNANSRAALMGNYHGTSTRYVTILDGILREVGDDINVFSSEGSHLFKDRVEFLGKENDRIKEAIVVAKNSDVVILCLGLDETLEGEEGDTGNGYASGDKTDLELPKSQIDLLNAIKDVGKPIVLVNMTGSSVNLSIAKESKNIKAILQAWYPGAEGGIAVSDVIFGKASPSGKLPITFYDSVDGFPDFEDYSMKGRTYRYIEGKAQYPFGFGLTYGSVVIKEAKIVDAAQIRSEALMSKEGLYSDSFQISAVLENNSTADVEEIVQVYVKDNESKYAVRNVSLCGFVRVGIKAGASKEVTLSVPTRSLLAVNEDGKWILDSKSFTFYVGVSQPDEQSVSLCKTKPATIELEL